jgi:hypothetical protein
MSGITSRPFRPDGEQCCEACVFGRGEHAASCEAYSVDWADLDRVTQTFAESD